MYKIFIAIFAAFAFAFFPPASAQKRQQGRPFDREAFQERRNAYVIEEMGLTAEEAAKFIPLYDELQRKKFEAGQRCRQLSRKIREDSEATPADYTNTVDECVGVKLKEAKIDVEYYDKFKTILSPEKLYKLTNAEYKFAREFLRGPGNRSNL